MDYNTPDGSDAGTAPDDSTTPAQRTDALGIQRRGRRERHRDLDTGSAELGEIFPQSLVSLPRFELGRKDAHVGSRHAQAKEGVAHGQEKAERSDDDQYGMAHHPQGDGVPHAAALV